MKFILISLILFSSCSLKKTNQRPKGHEELYSQPRMKELNELDKYEKKIVIASTNDLNGQYSPFKLVFMDQHTKENQYITMGGIEAFQSYYAILRKNYKDVLLFDSGNLFSGEQKLSEAKNFYDNNGYDAITLGVRDFDIEKTSKNKNNIHFLKDFSKSTKTPLIISNLYDLKTARLIEWKGAKSHLIKKTNGINVGVIGIIPDDIVEKTPTENRLGLYVEDMLQATLKHARILRSIGADIIVVLTNQAIDCNSKIAKEQNLPLNKVNFNPRQNEICDLQSPLGEYLNRLPPKLVDIVIGGRGQFKTANYVNNMIVMSGYPNGMSFNYAEIVYDTDKKLINQDKTVIHQPVYLCHEFFKETNDCFPEDPTINHGPKTPAYFLGEKVLINRQK